MSYTPAGVCVDCHKPLEHYLEAEYWTGRECLVDPDGIDIDQPGTTCRVTEEPHRLTDPAVEWERANWGRLIGGCLA